MFDELVQSNQVVTQEKELEFKTPLRLKPQGSYIVARILPYFHQKIHGDMAKCYTYSMYPYAVPVTKKNPEGVGRRPSLVHTGDMTKDPQEELYWYLKKKGDSLADKIKKKERGFVVVQTLKIMGKDVIEVKNDSDFFKMFKESVQSLVTLAVQKEIIKKSDQSEGAFALIAKYDLLNALPNNGILEFSESLQYLDLPSFGGLFGSTGLFAADMWNREAQKQVREIGLLEKLASYENPVELFDTTAANNWVLFTMPKISPEIKHFKVSLGADKNGDEQFKTFLSPMPKDLKAKAAKLDKVSEYLNYRWTPDEVKAFVTNTSLTVPSRIIGGSEFDFAKKEPEVDEYFPQRPEIKQMPKETFETATAAKSNRSVDVTPSVPSLASNQAFQADWDSDDVPF